jgi:Glycosyltransferase WbsX
MRGKQKISLTLILGLAIFVAAKPGPAIGRVSHQERIQVAAYYFPAWHNDALFPGKEGEWPALQNAKPRFPGQRQPKVPLWGYQDESDPAVMAQKINAAVDNGVSIFLFDWYWHDRGARKGAVLEKALDEGFLKAPNRSRMKFALMWANHEIGDSPGPIGRAGFETMTDHIVQDYFSSSSYLKINGRCYFSIYVLSNFIEGLGGVEEAKAALDSFRKKAAAAGFGGVYLNAIDYGIPKEQPDIIKRLGIDSVTSYVWVHKVHLDSFPETDYRLTGDKYFRYWDTHKNDYGVPYFPNVTSGWDPTPRVPADKPYDGKSAYPNTPVLWDNSPARFKSALQEAKARALTLPPGQRIVTIYAWNEWTEGGNLEPDTVTKMSYLRAIHDVFGSRP